jgi:uncharacterized protein (DUF1810 family)
VTADDPFDLERFLAAQAPVYELAVRELRAGHKRTHWMWFIFPQLRGLGRSSTAQFFGISSLIEARAYLAHPELGPRLTACVHIVMELTGRSLNAIFGNPDDVKFRSSMTLFAVADDRPDSIFRQAILRCCDGIDDDQTLALIEARASSDGVRNPPPRTRRTSI